jgi:hypothetical protein
LGARDATAPLLARSVTSERLSSAERRLDVLEAEAHDLRQALEQMSPEAKRALRAAEKARARAVLKRRGVKGVDGVKKAR